MIFVLPAEDAVVVGRLSEVNTSNWGDEDGVSAELETATGWPKKPINSVTIAVKDRPYAATRLATGTFFLCFPPTTTT